MGQVFDEADYRRKLEAAQNEIGTATELRFIANADLKGLNAVKAHQEAKEVALRQARKQMLQAIAAAERDQSFNGGLPTEVEEIVTGPSDQLVKVDGGVGK
ncbi:hypothetical protein ACVWXO_008110 [Bradyrhizobium sp. LM2.7]